MEFVLSERLSMIIFTLFMLIGLCFLWIYLTRSLFFDAEAIIAKITNINEGTTEVPDWVTPNIYYYPEISYEYEFNGNVYLGGVGKAHEKQFRLTGTTPLGSSRRKAEFFWRLLSEGDEITIVINKSDPSQSSLVEYHSKAYKSETKMFLVVSVFCFTISMVALTNVMLSNG